MIEYRYEKERDISLYYAEKLENYTAKNILEKGEVTSTDEATVLAKFFWEMVDALIADSKASKTICGENNLEEWSEYILGSFRAYLNSNGYSQEWDSASENA